MKDQFIIRFRGVRGSYPVPGKSTLHIGGNTACVEVCVNDHRIILDAGTGIISLGEELVAEHLASGDTPLTRKPIVVTLLYSHTHNDHTQGFPFFQPAYLPITTLYVFGPTSTDNLETTLARAMISPLFPVPLRDMSATKYIRDIEGNKVILLRDGNSEPLVYNPYREQVEIPEDAVKIACLHSYGHPIKVLKYRIEWHGRSVVYATDTEGYEGGDTRLIRFARDADVLIHDAQYRMDEYTGDANGVIQQGWGHSTPDMAVTVARKANVKQLVLFHHDPRHDDPEVESMAENVRQVFPNTVAAREGLEILL